VDRIAREYFTYLKDAKGAHQVVLGDGRISLERELVNNNRQQFDVLAVDAFSGDGIPIHLLTRESFALYWEHLQPSGILAFHITNYHFDFSPVIRALAPCLEELKAAPRTPCGLLKGIFHIQVYDIGHVLEGLSRAAAVRKLVASRSAGRRPSRVTGP